MVVLAFWRTSMLFSIVVAPIYISINIAQGFPLLPILIQQFICCLFNNSHFSQVWDSVSLWFWFAFSWWLVMLSIFSFVCWPSVCLLWKNAYSGSLPIFKNSFIAYLRSFMFPYKFEIICSVKNATGILTGTEMNL